MLKQMSEDLYATAIQGSTGTGTVELNNGRILHWDTDEEGERYYFILSADDEATVVYQPSRGIDPEYVIAALAIESTAQALEEGPYGKQ